MMLLERFGTVDLPLIEAEQDIGAVGTRGTLMDLPSGGAYDAYGSNQAPRGGYSLRARGETLVEAVGDLTAVIDTLRAKRGRRDKLYARMDDDSVRWVWARLRELPQTRTVDNVLFIASELRFDVSSPCWYGDRHGEGWTLDTGELFDTGLVLDEATGDVFTLDAASSTAIDVINNGNAPVDNAVLIFQPTADPIAGFTLTSTYDSERQAAITYSGTVEVGQTLVLDCGAQSATISTQLTADAAATDTDLDVDNSDGWTVGYTVEILLNSGDYHRTTIASLPDANSVTLTDAMPGAADIGAPVIMSAYPDLTFEDTHRLGSVWFRVNPGTTVVEIDLDSSDDATLTIEYADGWE